MHLELQYGMQLAAAGIFAAIMATFEDKTATAPVDKKDAVMALLSLKIGTRTLLIVALRNSVS
jgi:hypothetical protein